YANRKLYDTRDSRYVTLQQIAVFVREGEDVKIIDNTTKEDLTNVTLAQIVYETEKSREDEGQGASKRLRDMIQRSGERLMTTLRDGPVGKLVPHREEGESEPPPKRPRKALTRALIAQSRETLEELQRVADDRLQGVVQVAIHQVHQLQGEIGRLTARIEELEARLIKLQQKRPSATPPPDENTNDSNP
ncbi:MAG: polyhydroxyalkanoate synthesis regulator DNA-binding domain-containing protein, partial [Myxococcales bacterium]|nr:polyhydroxyalkanoate synthesis regulator DNA-binding domain-containing protein [Myxococcales bacterium]